MKVLPWLLLATLGVSAREFPPREPCPGPALRFREPARAAQSKLFVQWTAARTRGWSHMGRHLRGRHVGEYWVAGPDHQSLDDGIQKSFQDGPASRWYEWEVYFDRLPMVYGLHLEAGRNPSREGWGTTFSFYTGGAGIDGNSCELTYRRWVHGSVVDRQAILDPSLSLPDSLTGDDEYGLIRSAPRLWEAPADPEEQMARLCHSDVEFLKLARERLDVLQLGFQRLLAGHRIRKRDYERTGPGRLPVMRFRDATPAEEKVAAEFGRAAIQRWRANLQQNHKQFRAALLELLPAGLWTGRR